MLIYSHNVDEANYYTSIVTHIFHVKFLVLVTMAKVTQHGVGNIQCFHLIQRILVTWRNVWMKMIFLINHNVCKERVYAWMNCPCILWDFFIQEFGCLMCLCQYCWQRILVVAGCAIFQFWNSCKDEVWNV